MNRLTNLLLVLLLIAVILLGGAVFLLWQKDSPPASSSDPSAASSSSTASETASGAETAQELSCSVQLGALQLIPGDEFALQEGSESDCQISCENGVYTVSVNTTLSTPVVVTVPQDAYFQRATLTVSGGTLSAEDLTVKDLYTTCEKGALQFSGCVDGNAEVEHQQGETTLQLTGSSSDFNYNVSYQLGHVQIGEQAYAGAKGNQSVDNGCDKTIRVNCAMGSVGVVFSQG